MDTSDIDLVSKIDFTKGFQGFHIKWPLKDLQTLKLSPTFTTTISNGDGKLVLKWALIFDNSDQSDAFFGLVLLSDEKLMLPVIYRLSVSAAGKEPCLNQDNLEIFTSGSFMGFRLLSAEVAKYNGDDLAFHCWIDIPNAMVNYNLKKRKIDSIGENELGDSFQKKNSDSFTSDVVKLFKSVIDGDDSLSDITLAILGETNVVRRFPCHRIILSTRSSVFEVMFKNKEWKENEKNGERTVEIVEIDAETMEIVLNFIYTSSLPDKSSDCELIMKVIYAADKYNLPNLKNWCVSVLILEHSLPSLRAQQFVLADRHNLDQLKAICIAQLSINYLDYVKMMVFRHIPADLSSEILKAASKRQYETTEITLPST